MAEKITKAMNDGVARGNAVEVLGLNGEGFSKVSNTEYAFRVQNAEGKDTVVVVKLTVPKAQLPIEDMVSAYEAERAEVEARKAEREAERAAKKADKEAKKAAKATKVEDEVEFQYKLGIDPAVYLILEGGMSMTEREKSEILREEELKKVKKFYEEQGYMVERILSQNSPSSLILFTEDQEKNERYIEVKFIVKKPEYEPDEDIDNFKVEIHNRAVKKVKADINKLNKKDRILAEAQADIKVQEFENKYIGKEE